jgi:hypothetical protein
MLSFGKELSCTGASANTRRLKDGLRPQKLGLDQTNAGCCARLARSISTAINVKTCRCPFESEMNEEPTLQAFHKWVSDLANNGTCKLGINTDVDRTRHDYIFGVKCVSFLYAAMSILPSPESKRISIFGDPS